MKWAKPTPDFPTSAPREEEHSDFDHVACDDFNAPLAEQNSKGGTMTLDGVHNEAAMDVLDVEEAERRLADPNDKVIPFKSR